MTKSKTPVAGWYMDADFALDCVANRADGNDVQQSGGCQNRIEYKTSGAAVKKDYPVPDKETMFDENGKESFMTVMEIVELSKATLDAKMFDVPASYREVKNTSELFAGTMTNLGGNALNENSKMNQTIINLAQNQNAALNELGARKEDTILIGITSVKSGRSAME